MRYGCPNENCRNYKSKRSIVRDGSYKRKNDSRIVKRLKCQCCKKRFSNATFSLAKGQKKRRVNYQLYKLLSSGVSMRRAAKLLGINRTTVHRKLIYLSKKAEIKHNKFLFSLQKKQVTHMQFDDLITSEHTKLKPLSITLAVDVNSRKMLGFEVSTIPAFGHLAKLSVEKYGKRKSQHAKGIDKLFTSLKGIIHQNALIESDEHKLYNPFVKKHFPLVKHKQFKGGRGCVAGQGELKRLHYDPLFILNHTCAMLRANICRLIRKTWCTTKSPEMLKKHLAIYMLFHNGFT